MDHGNGALFLGSGEGDTVEWRTARPHPGPLPRGEGEAFDRAGEMGTSEERSPILSGSGNGGMRTEEKRGTTDGECPFPGPRPAGTSRGEGDGVQRGWSDCENHRHARRATNIHQTTDENDATPNTPTPPTRTHRHQRQTHRAQHGHSNERHNQRPHANPRHRSQHPTREPRARPLLPRQQPSHANPRNANHARTNHAPCNCSRSKESWLALLGETSVRAPFLRAQRTRSAPHRTASPFNAHSRARPPDAHARRCAKAHLAGHRAAITGGRTAPVGGPFATARALNVPPCSSISVASHRCGLANGSRARRPAETARR